MSLKQLLLNLILPACGGILLGVILTREVERSDSATGKSGARSLVKEAPLPDDPAIIRIAALAGRTKVARKKIGDLIAAGAKDDEIAEWLSLILFSDPGSLDKFILTVPEGRRIGLVRMALLKVSRMQADAAWEAIRSSPFALQAARSDLEVEKRKGVDILGYCLRSPFAAETVLDPSFGFTEQEIAATLRFTSGVENARRILEEWKNGRWKGEPPGFVRDAWAHFWFNDKDALQEIGKSLPEEYHAFTDRFNALNEQDQHTSKNHTIPSAEDLSKLGKGELMQAFQDQWVSGNRIPLETLTQLPAELRKAGIENYFKQDDTFHPDMARNCVEQLDRLNLTNPEKQTLLEGTAAAVWENQGDYQTALQWAARMPDAAGREKFETNILTEFARADPHGALEFIATLPAGKLRETIERIATEALP